MNKHEKQVRRERRKADSTRRRLRHPTSHFRHRRAAALAAAGAIAAGTQAYAVPIRFDNPPGPGHFQWDDASSQPGSSLRWLEVTQDAQNQPAGPFDFTNAPPSAFGQNEVDGWVFSSYGGPAQDGALQVDSVYGSFFEGVNAGELIPSGFPWAFYGVAYYAGYPSQFPPDVPTYLGVRFDLGSAFQYGWVGVTRSGAHLDAFAWGYETEPGVPIAAGAPEPGSLALLALGAVGVLTRRRR